MQTYSVTKRDGTVLTCESVWTDQAAASLLVQLGKTQRSEFAQSLVARTVNRQHTPATRAWLHVLATEAISPRPPVPETRALSCLAIHGMLASAASHLKRPKVVYSSCTLVWLAKGKVPMSVLVVDRPGFGNQMYGRIHPDGRFEAHRACPDTVVAFLTELEADPAGVSAREGKALGQCVFCANRLADERSLAVGYGKICADHWHLPWGAKASAA